jgi:hypothetical protein
MPRNARLALNFPSPSAPSIWQLGMGALALNTGLSEQREAQH